MSDPGPAPDPESDQDVSRLLRLAGPRPGVPADVAARVHAAAHEAWRRGVSRRRRLQLSAAAAIAALLAVALGRPPSPPPAPAGPPVMVLERATGGGVRRLDTTNGGSLAPGDGVPVGVRIETAPDGRAAWRVAGASLRLDASTRLQVLSASTVALEEGALYVDGDGSRRAPLEVRTSEGRVRELGTQFEVRASAGRLGVRVREGDVVVLRRDDVYEARAGSGLEVGAGMVARHRVAVHGPEWSWMEQIAPEFPMEGRTLQSLVDWTARETGWSIRFARTSDSARAEQVILHGSGMGLAPSQVLEVALPACGLTFRRQDGTVWIEPARATR